jgi:hypothetical protein
MKVSLTSRMNPCSFTVEFSSVFEWCSIRKVVEHFMTIWYFVNNVWMCTYCYYIDLVLRLRICAVIPLLPHVFMAWCLIKHREDFTYVQYSLCTVKLTSFINFVKPVSLVLLLQILTDIARYTCFLSCIKHVECQELRFLQWWISMSTIVWDVTPRNLV